ncbi:hypothetical protein RPMA_08165 [Tardiphaga alba]|uniref:DUF6894 domain-containing protein n=1 Tax=Tardiphaga alba TaxID=340268 RepID=A0ABX8A675_9BRAD|nr:hypothetical protein [Tardiphaga alba]QUS38811.1 hypothetical protein RPMA_08165 [Tardiphaga alba]
MTRYFIHLVDGEDVICDPEGSDLPGMAIAREQAVLSAREILAEAIKAGKHHIPRFVVVVSEGGNEVAVIDIRTMLPSCLA